MSVLIITKARMIAFNSNKLRTNLRCAPDQHERDSVKYNPIVWMVVIPPKGKSGDAMVVQWPPLPGSILNLLEHKAAPFKPNPDRPTTGPPVNNSKTFWPPLRTERGLTKDAP
jgi:hypothetical protein